MLHCQTNTNLNYIMSSENAQGLRSVPVSLTIDHVWLSWAEWNWRHRAGGDAGVLNAPVAHCWLFFSRLVHPVNLSHLWLLESLWDTRAKRGSRTATVCLLETSSSRRLPHFRISESYWYIHVEIISINTTVKNTGYTLILGWMVLEMQIDLRFFTINFTDHSI